MTAHTITAEIDRVPAISSVIRLTHSPVSAAFDRKRKTESRSRVAVMNLMMVGENHVYIYSKTEACGGPEVDPMEGRHVIW